MKILEIARQIHDRIPAEKIDPANYISTDNMKPWFGGYEPGTTVPSGTLTSYQAGDILLSNIRPYFRKTWLATHDGGCNADVLCIRANESQCVPEYLYYVFCTNGFVEDYLKGSKGAKMPRGDINRLLNYEIRLPEKADQLRIAGLLGSLDEKIALCRKKIAELEALAKLIYERWFIAFEFPDVQGKPYKSNGGKFAWSNELKQAIPADWDSGPLGKYVDVHRGASPRPIQEFLATRGPRWLKISDASKSQSPFIFEIEDHIREEGISKTVSLKAGSLVLSNSASPGIPRFLGVDSCIHDGWLYFPTSQFSYEYLFLLFEKIRPALVPQGNGSVFTNLKTDILKMFPVVRPTNETLSRFDSIARPVFDSIRWIEATAQETVRLRDRLLPMLMNGQVEVRA